MEESNEKENEIWINIIILPSMYSGLSILRIHPIRNPLLTKRKFMAPPPAPNHQPHLLAPPARPTFVRASHDRNVLPCMHIYQFSHFKIA